MKSSHKTLTWLAAGLVLLAAGIAYSFWSYHQISNASGQRHHSRVVINMASDLLSDLKDAQLGQRGYLLTRNEAYLAPYLKAHDGINGKFDALRQITSLAATRKHLDALAPLISASLEEFEQSINALRADKSPHSPVLAANDTGKRLMDQIRTEMDGFVDAQTNAQLKNDIDFDASMRHLFITLVSTSALAVLFALFIAGLTHQRSQQHAKDQVHFETRHLLSAQEASNRLLAQANRRLRDQEQTLSITLNSIGDAVISTDSAACVTLLNPAAQLLTGWTQAEAAGQPINKIFHIINKETRELSSIPVEQTLMHGTTHGLANHTVLVSRDGREYDISDSCAPIQTTDGQVVGAVLIFRNVTEEYAVQQSLRDSTALIQTILNTVVDGIVTVHAHGGAIEATNPAIENMFGYPASELTGQYLGLLIPELGQSQPDVSLAYYRASDEARAMGAGREVIGRRKNGSSFPLEIAVSEMVLGGQRFFTGILRDISRRKATEAERVRLDLVLREKNTELESAKLAADKANLAKSEFLSSMSHELRSPLNAILGFAQLMESGSPPPTTVQKASIDQILKAGWYLLELINEVLDLALIESGRLSLSVEPTSLPDVLEDCKTMIEPMAQQRKISLHFPELETPCFVCADRTRLKQVVINLLSNAIKYNRIGGSVTVTVTGSPRVQARTRIRVRDTGDGLSPSNLAQLFQPFNRLGKENSDEQGTGIGLVVSKRLVEQMGGEMGVSSTLGAGSEFWIELDPAGAPQLHEEMSELLPLVCASDGATAPARLRTLLYVEDNRANMELVRQLVARRPDMHLLGAQDALHGIALAKTCQPDLILMDINLPGISGLQALKLLRDDPGTRQIPVLALSANAMVRDIDKGLEAGFFRYLTKPIRVGEFMTALDEGLALAAVQTQKESQPKEVALKPGASTA